MGTGEKSVSGVIEEVLVGPYCTERTHMRCYSCNSLIHTNVLGCVTEVTISSLQNENTERRIYYTWKSIHFWTRIQMADGNVISYAGNFDPIIIHPTVTVSVQISQQFI